MMPEPEALETCRQPLDSHPSSSPHWLCLSTAALSTDSHPPSSCHAQTGLLSTVEFTLAVLPQARAEQRQSLLALVRVSRTACAPADSHSVCIQACACTDILGVLHFSLVTLGLLRSVEVFLDPESTKQWLPDMNSVLPSPASLPWLPLRHMSSVPVFDIMIKHQAMKGCSHRPCSRTCAPQ